MLKRACLPHYLMDLPDTPSLARSLHSSVLIDRLAGYLRYYSLNDVYDSLFITQLFLNTLSLSPTMRTHLVHRKDLL